MDFVIGPVARIQALVAEHYQLPRRIMTSPDVSRPYPQARWVAMYLAHTILGQGPAALGRRFKRDPRTISYGIDRVANDPELLSKVEELRERLVG